MKKPVKRKDSQAPILGPAMQEGPEDEAFGLTNAASATECTGLIQVPPEDEDQLENYADVYSFAQDPPKPQNQN